MKKLIRYLKTKLHIHSFDHYFRPIGGYDFDYYHCECGRNKLEKNDPKEKWFSDEEFNIFLNRKAE